MSCRWTRGRRRQLFTLVCSAPLLRDSGGSGADREGGPHWLGRRGAHRRPSGSISMHIERPRRLLPARASCTPRTVKLRKCESHRARAPRRPRPAPDHPASRVSGWERRGVERASGSGRHIPPSVSVRVLLLRQAVFSLCSAQPPLRTLARSGLYHSSTREHADSPPLDRPPRFFRARAGGGHWPAGPTGRLVAQNFEDRLEFS